MAKNKSKDNYALSLHVVTYTAVFGIGSFIALYNLTTINTILLFIFINGVLHFIVDYITSRITSRLWAEGKVHDFFVVIGVDQYIHQLCIWPTLMGMIINV